ncbi:MAG: cobalamin-dependent protein [Actinobacteria bacterium]|nr:cobalamin-dependent protein [Actinomycetota bacterium]MBU1945037.1 cobalamin-dependent protein [Actinomycetota bacterium]MBU2686627.1 cobalamin-dependent protein [Actinomycetota bacterium]
MKIDLVVPENEEGVSVGRKAFLPPLGLMYLAAYTPGEARVRIIDENVEPIDYSDLPDLVGISTVTTTAPRAYRIADTYRSRGIKVVLGGVHPSMVPGEALVHADAVVVGEGEAVWPRVVSETLDGLPAPVYRADRYLDFHRPLLPRRDLINPGGYLSANVVQTSRGCPMDCPFCSVTRLFGRRYRMRDVDNVIAEIETLPRNRVLGRVFIPFVDAEISAGRKRARDLFKGFIPLRLRWGSRASASFADDEELVSLAAESGCRFLFMGLEELFSAEGDRDERVERVGRAVRLLNRHRIHVIGDFAFGFDTDYPGAFSDAASFAMRNRVPLARFKCLTPYPGTGLYEKLLADGRLEPGFWLKPGWESRVVFEPAGIGPELLKEKVERAQRDIYSVRSIIKRMPSNRHSAYLFPLNLLYRLKTRA